MRKATRLFVIVLLALCASVFAGLQVTSANATPGPFTGGLISADLTLTAADSPYVITSTIQVPTGMTVTIEPGVSIENKTNGALFYVHGTVNMIGSLESPIFIDSQSSLFKLNNAETARIIARFVRFEGHSNSSFVDGGAGHASFQIQDCDFVSMATSGIWYPNALQVERNVFVNSGGWSVGTSVDGVMFRNNLIQDPPAGSIWLNVWAEYSRTMNISKNSFASGPYLAIATATTSNELNANENFWGSLDPVYIQSKVRDYHDGLDYGPLISTLTPLAQPDVATPAGLRWESLLSPGLEPAFSEPIRTRNGFKVEVTNYDPSFTWENPTTSAGYAYFNKLQNPKTVEVTGLSPNASATVSLSTSRPGYTRGSSHIEASALPTTPPAVALTPTFGPVTSVLGGFYAVVTNYDPAFSFDVSTDMGGVAVAAYESSDFVVRVSGLFDGERISVFVATRRTGYPTGYGELVGSPFSVLTLNGVDPQEIAPGGTLTLQGRGFANSVDANEVRINNNLVPVEAGQYGGLKVQIPANARIGQATVSVTVDGETVTANFTIVPKPAISSVSPAGSYSGGLVVISGTGFPERVDGYSLKFEGSIHVPYVTFSSANTVKVIVPAGAVTGRIRLTAFGVTITSPTDLIIGTPPTISSISQATALRGSSVVITGTGFSATPSANRVLFGTTVATVTQASATSLTVTVPAAAAIGTNAVSVTVANIPSATRNVQVVAAHTVGAITSNPTYVGASVTIPGTNFSTTPATNVVTFAGSSTPATVTAATASSLTVTVPSDATTGRVSVALNGLTVSSATPITVGVRPAITSLTRATGARGATVTISGTGFSATPNLNRVLFGSAVATVTQASTTSLTVKVPTAAVIGETPVSVAVANIASATSAFGSLAAHTVTTVAPSIAYVGASMTIAGSAFSTTPGNNIVTFTGASSAATVTSATATSLTVTVPAGAATGPVRVALNGLIVASTGNATIGVRPSMDAFQVTSAARGAPVTLIGTGFSATHSANRVLFGSAVAVVTQASATSLTLTVPVAATLGQSPVSVTVGGLTSATQLFTVVAAHTVSSVSPAATYLGGTITITGTGFSTTRQDNMVVFEGNSVPAEVTMASPTRLLVTVPDGVISAKVRVTLNGLTVSSPAVLVIGVRPTIASFSVASAARGGTIFITGTNFSATASANKVMFGSIAGTVTVASRTALTVTVPTNAAIGANDVIVTTGGLTSVASTIQVLAAHTISSIAPTSARVGTNVTITGTGFSSTSASNQVVFTGTSTAGVVVSATATTLTVTVPVGATTGAIKVTLHGLTVTSSARLTIIR